MLTHFGGGTRPQSAAKKRSLIGGMKPYFQKGYHLNESVGFGYVRRLFYYFIVDHTTLSMTILEMQDPKNDVWEKTSKDHLSSLFRQSYENSYSFNKSTASVAHVETHHKVMSTVRRGNESDSAPWTKHCRSMINVPVVQVPKLSADDKLLL